MRQVSQAQDVKRRAKTNTERPTNYQIDARIATQQFMNRFMDERPEGVVHKGNGNYAQTPPHAPRQETKRENK